MTRSGELPSRCPNCGAEAGGEYCPACGQSQRIETPSVWGWLKRFFHEVLEINGRLPRTLKVLFLQPGRLTEDWLAGRRARYLRPVRLYLFCSFVFFVGAIAVPEARPAPDSGVRQSVTDMATGWAEGYKEAGGNAPGPVVVQALAGQMQTVGPQVFFVMMPFFALLVMVFYRKGGRSYIDHLIFSVHVHSFAFLWLSVAWALVEALPLGGLWVDVPFFLLLGALVVYLVLALSRAYGQSRLWSTVKGGFLLGLHTLIVFVVLFLTATIAEAALWGPRAEAGDADQTYWEIQERFQRGDSGEARTMLPDAIVKYRRLEAHFYDPDTRYHLGRLLLRADEPAEALELARQGLVEDSTQVLTLGLAARATEELGREEEAREYYRRYLRAYDETIDAYRENDSRHAPELEAMRERALELGVEPAGGPDG